jgi:hypothetical protein
LDKEDKYCKPYSRNTWDQNLFEKNDLWLKGNPPSKSAKNVLIRTHLGLKRYSQSKVKSKLEWTKSQLKWLEEGVPLLDWFIAVRRFEKKGRMGSLLRDMFNINLRIHYYKPCGLCGESVGSMHFRDCKVSKEIRQIIGKEDFDSDCLSYAIWWYWLQKRNRKPEKLNNFIYGKLKYLNSIYSEVSKETSSKRKIINKKIAKANFAKKSNGWPKIGETHIYTDGSRKGDRAGCSIILISNRSNLEIQVFNFKVEEELEDWSELVALRLAVNLREKLHPGVKIFTDSKISLDIAKNDPKWWFDQNEGIQNLFKIPSHCGFWGNELADIGAKGGKASEVEKEMNVWLRRANTGVKLYNL